MDGEALYSDVFSMAPPLFIASLRWAFQVAGDTVPVGRAVIVLYSAVGLLGVGLLAREWGGRLAGLFAVAALALAPHFYVLSRVIIADTPSMGLSCLALWAAVRYDRTGRRGWLAVSGLVLAAGMCLKLTAGLVAPVIIMLVLARDLSGLFRGRMALMAAVRRVASSALVLGGAVLFPLALCFVLYDRQKLWHQVVALLWVQQETFIPDWTANAQLIIKYLLVDNFNVALNRGLTLLALTGVVALAFRSRKDALVWALWTVIVVGVGQLRAAVAPPAEPYSVPSGRGGGDRGRRAYTVSSVSGSGPIGRSAAMALGGLLLAGMATYVYDWPRASCAKMDGGDARPETVPLKKR